MFTELIKYKYVVNTVLDWSSSVLLMTSVLKLTMPYGIILFQHQFDRPDLTSASTTSSSFNGCRDYF